MRYLIISIFCLATVLLSNEFLLFEETTPTDPSVFTDFKYNKLKTSYTVFPLNQKKFATTYTRFFNNKTGFFAEAAVKERGSSFYQKSEFSAGLAYRLTSRAWTWVFQGNIGLSANDDLKDISGRSKGFRVNHIVGRFTPEYIFRNGFGFDVSMTVRMPIQYIDIDVDMRPVLSAGFIYQF